MNAAAHEFFGEFVNTPAATPLSKAQGATFDATFCWAAIVPAATPLSFVGARITIPADGALTFVTSVSSSCRETKERF